MVARRAGQLTSRDETRMAISLGFLIKYRDSKWNLSSSAGLTDQISEISSYYVLFHKGELGVLIYQGPCKSQAKP